MKPIPYGKQYIDAADISSVVKVLKSDWITHGPMVSKFENKLAEYCGAKYTVAVSSGTAALHIACLAAGLKKGDEAITTPITFLATPNSVLYCGARPVFADIDYNTVNIDPVQISEKITKKTKAILPVHFAGLPCDMPRIYDIAKNKNIVIIEDAAHALGAEYKHKGKWCRVGSCRHSDMTTFSFHPVKHITTGEGGAVTTNNKKLYERLKALRSHGIYKDKITGKKGSWYYEMRDLGFNYRITDFQCALGVSQLRRLNNFIIKRKKIASIYDKAFSSINDIEIQRRDKTKKHAYHLYILKIEFKKFGITRQKFVDRLKNKGIITQVHYIPVYYQPYYRKLYNINPNNFKTSEEYYQKALSIPMYSSMRDKDICTIIDTLKKALGLK